MKRTFSLGRAGKDLTVPLTDPVVKALAEKKGKSPAQILIKHLVQKGCIVIPKSIKQVRNRAIFFDIENQN